MNLSPDMLIPEEPDPVLKRCPRCECSLLPEEFGIDRSRADSTNLYCRQCTREKRLICYHKRPPKPSLPAPLWLTGSPKEKVLAAIQHGAVTQSAIKRLTQLSIDRIGDELARLYDAGKLNRAALRRRRYISL